MALSKLSMAGRRAFHSAAPRAARILCLDNIDPVSEAGKSIQLKRRQIGPVTVMEALRRDESRRDTGLFVEDS